MKKKILMIATGGTIASESEGEGLKPALSSAQLLSYIPQVHEFCEIETLQGCNKDSTNLLPEDWLHIAALIHERYEDYDGFVVSHGTDTMAYGAAMLSYLIQDSQKPIVVTGSQKPISMTNTDARTNLLHSFLYAADEDSANVVVVFDGKVIAGTRAKKVRSKSYSAFDSINFPCLAEIQDTHIIRYIPTAKNQPVTFYNKLDDRIILLKLIPGMKSDIFELIFSHYDCIILESFGVGGIPEYLYDAFESCMKKHPDKIVVMTTQVHKEGSDMEVYEVGQRVKRKFNTLESYDMTPEATICKMMWLLGTFSTKEEITARYYQTIHYDILKKYK